MRETIDFYQRIFSGLVNRWVEILLVEPNTNNALVSDSTSFKALELGNRSSPRKKIIFAPIISYTYFRNLFIIIEMDMDVKISHDSWKSAINVSFLYNKDLKCERGRQGPENMCRVWASNVNKR